MYIMDTDTYTLSKSPKALIIHVIMHVIIYLCLALLNNLCVYMCNVIKPFKWYSFREQLDDPETL